MEWTQLWPLLVAVVGTGGIGTQWLIERNKKKSGKADLERLENLSLVERADYAESLRDWEMAKRRIAMEHAGELRLLCIEYGVPSERIGEWPTFPSMPEPPNKRKES